MAQGSLLLPSIYNSSTSIPSQTLSWQDAMHQTLASLIEMVDLEMSLQSLDPRPEQTLAAFNLVIQSIRAWVSAEG